MISTLNRKLLRDLWGAKGSWGAVAAVVLCAVVIHVSMAGTMRNLDLTRDAYLRDCRFADLFFHVERAPRSVENRIAGVPGVARARGRILRDVNLDVPGNPDTVTGRLVSIPCPRKPILNDLHLASGSWPSDRDAAEALVNPKFAEANDLERGSRIRAVIGNRKVDLEITGTALSPEFILEIRDAASWVPDPKAFAIVFAPEGFVETVLGFENAVNDVVVDVEESSDEGAVKAAVEDVLDPYGLSLKVARKDQISWQFLDNEIRGLKDTVVVMPPVFLGVAAVIVFTLISRLVQAQRTQIGVFQAFGFSRLRVAAHYAGFAAVTAAAGTLPALVAGDAMGVLFLRMYTLYFQFPVLRHRVYPSVYAEAGALSLALCGLAGVLAALRVLRLPPAEAMRPPSPPGGGAIWLERWTRLWARLPFSLRMLLRNALRHKGRSFFSWTGSLLAGMLLVIAFASLDTIRFVTHVYMRLSQRQDAKAVFLSPRPKEALRDLAAIEGVAAAEPLLEAPFELRSGWRKKTAVLTGVGPRSRMLLLMGTDGRERTVPERGLLLNATLAGALGVGPGDRVRAKALYPGFEETGLLVAEVFEEAVGLNGYMRLAELERMLGESSACSAALLRLDPGAERRVNGDLKEVGALSAVVFSSRLFEEFEKAVAQSMAYSMGIFVLFAGAIAFAVLYNGAVVALAERARELASLRVFGFTQREAAFFLLGEFYALVLLSLPAGLAVGYLAGREMMAYYGTDFVRFPWLFSPGSAAWTVGLVLAFAAVAGLAVNRKLRRLDLVEALKARE